MPGVEFLIMDPERFLNTQIPIFQENGVSGQAKDDDKSDIAQLFKIAKQLGKS